MSTVDAPLEETTTLKSKELCKPKKFRKGKAKTPPKASVKKSPAKKDAPKKQTAAKDAAASVGEQPKNVKDRASAKSVGMGLIHYRVLRGLQRATTVGEAMTYRDIEKVTGYYASLASIMHTDAGFAKGSSLCGKGLAKQIVIPDKKDRGHVAFTITAKGAKLLEKAATPAKVK